MQLSIIIVSYNSEKLTLKCLESLYASNDHLKWEVIVIDNASSDNSVTSITKNFPDVHLITNPTNIGFGRANNQGSMEAKGEYLLFLNSDCEVLPDTLEDWYDLAEAHKANLSSCTLVNSDGSIQPQGGSLPTLTNIFDWMFFFDDLPLINRLIVPYQQRSKSYFHRDHQMGWVGGTALLIKRSIFEKLEGFDENIFMYGEDVELCYRAHLLGYGVQYFAKPQVRHVGQGSGSSENAILGEYKGLLYLWKKHKPAWTLWFIKLNLIFGALFRIVIFGMIRGDAKKRVIYTKALSLVG